MNVQTPSFHFPSKSCPLHHSSLSFLLSLWRSPTTHPLILSLALLHPSPFATPPTPTIWSLRETQHHPYLPLTRPPTLSSPLWQLLPMGLYWAERQKKLGNFADLGDSCGRTRSPCEDLIVNSNNKSLGRSYHKVKVLFQEPRLEMALALLLRVIGILGRDGKSVHAIILKSFGWVQIENKKRENF